MQFVTIHSPLPNPLPQQKTILNRNKDKLKLKNFQSKSSFPFLLKHKSDKLRIT